MRVPRGTLVRLSDGRWRRGWGRSAPDIAIAVGTTAFRSVPGSSLAHLLEWRLELDARLFDDPIERLDDEVVPLDIAVVRSPEPLAEQTDEVGPRLALHSELSKELPLDRLSPLQNVRLDPHSTDGENLYGRAQGESQDDQDAQGDKPSSGPAILRMDRLDRFLNRPIHHVTAIPLSRLLSSRSFCSQSSSRCSARSRRSSIRVAYSAHASDTARAPCVRAVSTLASVVGLSRSLVER
jgi:hypothetical protein